MSGISSALSVGILSIHLLLSLSETATHTASDVTRDAQVPDVEHASSRFWMSARWKRWVGNGTRLASSVMNARAALASRGGSLFEM